MRRLVKGPLPPVLAANQGSWTQTYVDAETPEDRKINERWRHAGIKMALKTETSSKCAYCEAYVDDVSYPHVEHIKPKSLFPALAHEWSNLTSACSRCNIAKKDYYVAGMELINPYDEDPALFLVLRGPFVDFHLGNQRAEITVKKVQLNRIDLVQARTRRLGEVRELISRWHSANGPLRGVLEDTIRLETAEGEFTRAVTALLIEHGFPVEAQA